MVPTLEDLLHISSPDRVSAIAVLVRHRLVFRMAADVFSQIQKGANAARSDDTRSMKSAILDWIAPSNGEPIRPHIPRNSKLDRGFNHEITGALLCPASMDWKKEE